MIDFSVYQEHSIAVKVALRAQETRLPKACNPHVSKPQNAPVRLQFPICLFTTLPRGRFLKLRKIYTQRSFRKIRHLKCAIFELESIVQLGERELLSIWPNWRVS